MQREVEQSWDARAEAVRSSRGADPNAAAAAEARLAAARERAMAAQREREERDAALLVRAEALACLIRTKLRNYGAPLRPCREQHST